MQWLPKYRGLAEGPHAGIEYVNVDGVIARLCTRSDGEIDMVLYRRYHEDYSLDDAYDHAEMRQVARSWHDATLANMELRRAHSR